MSEEQVSASVEGDVAAVVAGSVPEETAGAVNGATPAEMKDLSADALAENGETTNLESILDIPIRLSIEIGNARMNIGNLLTLNAGSVVELDRLAGEPLDVLINGTLIAHGEVVVVNEKFGIRLTDVVSAQDRVRKAK